MKNLLTIAILCIAFKYAFSTSLDYNSIDAENYAVGISQCLNSPYISFHDPWTLEGEFSIGYAVQYDKEVIHIT